MNSLPTPNCCATQCDTQVSVEIPGPKGDKGDSGTNGIDGTNGGNAFTTLAAPMTQPAVSANVVGTVVDNRFIVQGENIFVQFLGTMRCFAKSGTTGVTFTNLGFPYSAAPGTIAGIGALVAPTGERGPQGDKGDPGDVAMKGDKGDPGQPGANATTTLAANFTMPNVGSNVSTQVTDSTFEAVGQVVFVETAGYLSVVSKADSTHAVLQNLGYPGNAAPTTVINSGSRVSPAGVRGAAGAAGASGNALQVVTAGTTASSEVTATIPYDNTIPQKTEGAQILTLNITPSSITSRIVVRALINCGCSTTANIILALFKDAGSDAIAAAFQAQAAATYPNQISLVHSFVPGSTAAMTLALRIGIQFADKLGINGTDAGAGVVPLFGGVMGSWMIAEEWAS